MNIGDLARGLAAATGTSETAARTTIAASKKQFFTAAKGLKDKL